VTIQSSRIKVLNEHEPRAEADYVLYLMHEAMRAGFNPALELAVDEANARNLPVVCAFGLLDGKQSFPDANARHYAFLLQGLADAKAALEKRGIAFVLLRASPDAAALKLAPKAALVVLDHGYLAVQRTFREKTAKGATCRVVAVEGNVVVPVETASPKHEYGARTLRPKLHRVWDDYIEPLTARRVKRRADHLSLRSDLDVSDPEGALAKMDLDTKVGPVRRFVGGEREAMRRLKAYLGGPFADYGATRGKPEAGAASHMSPYLHFGQISPVAIALAVREAAKGSKDDKGAYLEELVVRRELAVNHVYYAPHYATYEAVPEWARKTLRDHAKDKREHRYDRAQLEAGETHDEYWNAAMREMRETGYMHNHMRMYWGKKVLEWTPEPQAAFDTLLAINNTYFLDGRDANSFTNVAWVFGLHDRPWARRPIFGTVRYLSANTLRKFDAKAYLRTVDALCRAEG
jgi:deoxyribodipyrimidine photo-lyase